MSIWWIVLSASIFTDRLLIYAQSDLLPKLNAFALLAVKPIVIQDEAPNAGDRGHEKSNKIDSGQLVVESLE